MSEELEMPRDAQGRGICSLYGMSDEEFGALDEHGKIKQYLIAWAGQQSAQIYGLKELTELNGLSAQLNQAEELDEHTGEIEQEFARSNEMGLILPRTAKSRNFMLDYIAWMQHLVVRDNIEDAERKIAVVAKRAISEHAGIEDNINHGLLFYALLGLKGVEDSLNMWRDLLDQLIPFGEARSKLASEGGAARAANDPKQKEKGFVFQCWQDWQKSKTAENPKGTYSSKAAFARDMLEKYEHLISQKKIEDWCREWEKAHPAG